ncbi:MAG: flagellar hook-basal body protein [Deltaproteobacteria bacterium]|nr:flagellar hook-basal body protein [Deltaproteobacteria bacterium]
MERGTYISASGGMNQLRKLDVVNNNLANVNTPGFKKELLVGSVHTFDQTLASMVASKDPYAKGDHERTPGAVHAHSVTDFSLGPIKDTGNELDLALRNPKDFFVINTPSGPRYTRAGNFTLNSEGQISTLDGMQVAGDGGAITITGAPLAISPNGSVTSKGILVGKLQVVHFDDPKVLEREGSSRFTLPAGKPPPVPVEPDVIPRSLEMSNVSAITSMIDLIAASKGFEMYTKTAQTIDGMNQSAIGQVGRRPS